MKNKKCEARDGILQAPIEAALEDALPIPDASGAEVQVINDESKNT